MSSTKNQFDPEDAFDDYMRRVASGILLKKGLHMVFDVDRVGNDSGLRSPNPRNDPNEPKDFSRPVAVSRKAPSVQISRTSHNRTGFSFPCVERSDQNKTEVAGVSCLFIASFLLCFWRPLRSGNVRSVQFTGNLPACHPLSVIAEETTARIAACSHPNPEIMVERAGEWKARGVVKDRPCLKNVAARRGLPHKRNVISACLGEHGPLDLCAVKTAMRYFIPKFELKALWQQGAFQLSSSLPEV